MARVLSDAAYYALAKKEEDEFEDSSRPVRSFTAGLTGLKGSMENAGAAIARSAGLDSLGKKLEYRADETAAKAAGQRGYVPTLEEADSIGDYGTIAADWVFANAPLMAGTIASGGVGGLAAKGVAKAIGSNIGRATTVGRTAGAAVPYGGTTTGETYGRIRRDPDAEGTPAEQARAAILSGSAQAALGLGPLGTLGHQLSKGAGFARTLGTTALAEGVTEAGESAISRYTHGRFNKDVNMFDADARREYLESFLAGGVVGGAYGGLGAGLGAMMRPRQGGPGTIDDMEGGMEAVQNARRLEQERIAAAQVDQFGNPKEDAVAQQRLDDLYRLNDLVNNSPELFDGDVKEPLAKVREGAELEDLSYDEQNMLADVYEELTGRPARTKSPWLNELKGVLGANTQETDTLFGWQYDQEAARLAEENFWQEASLGEVDPGAPQYVFSSASKGEEGGSIPFNRNTGGATQAIERMAASDNANDYREVPWRDVLDSEYEQTKESTGETRDEFNKRKVRELVQAKGWNLDEARKYFADRKMTTNDIINQYSAIEKTAKSVDQRSVEERAFEITAEESAMARKGSGGRYGSKPFVRYRNEPEFPGQKREVTGTFTDKNGQTRPAQVDMRNLTAFMKQKLTKLGVMPKDLGVTQQAAFAASAGLSALMDASGIKIKQENIPDDTVIFQKQGGDVTWGQVKDIYNVGLRYEKRLEELRQLIRTERSAIESGVMPDETAVARAEARIEALTQEGLTLRKQYDKMMYGKERSREDLGFMTREEFDNMREAPEFVGWLAAWRKNNRDQNRETENESMFGYGEEDAIAGEDGVENLSANPEGVPMQPRNPLLQGAAPEGEVEGRVTELEQRYTRGDEAQYGGQDPRTLELPIIEKNPDPESVVNARWRDATLNRLRQVEGMMLDAQAEATETELTPERATQIAKLAKARDKLVKEVNVARQAVAEALAAEQIAAEAREAELEDARNIIDDMAGGFEQTGRQRGRQWSTLEKQAAAEEPALIKLVDMIANMFGIDVSYATLAEARAMLEARGDETRLERMRTGEQKGFHYLDENGRSKVWFDPGMTAGKRVATMAHEIGHAIHRQAWDSIPQELRSKIYAEHKAWAEKHGKDAIGEEFILSRRSSLFIDSASGRETEGFDFNDLSEADRAKLLSFEEWFADQVARWIETNTEPTNIIEQFFKGIAQKLRKMVKELKAAMPTASVQELLDGMVEARRNAETVAVDTTAEQMQFEFGGEAAPIEVDTESENAVWFENWKEAGMPLDTASLDKLGVALRESLFGGEYDVLVRAATSAVMQSRMRKVLDKPSQRFLEDPDTAATLMAALSMRGDVATGPETAGKLEKWSTKMGAKWDHLAGRLSGREQIEALMDVINEAQWARAADGTTGRPNHRSSVELDPDTVMPSRKRELVLAIEKVVENSRKWYNKIMATPYERMLETDNPHLIRVARALFVKSWDSRNVDEGFINGKERIFHDFMKQYEEILGDKLRDPKHQAAVRDALLNVDVFEQSSPEVQATVKEVRKLFDKIYRYTRNAGLEFSKRGDYTPWIFDTEFTLENMHRLVNLAEQQHFRQHWFDLQRSRLKNYLEENGHTLDAYDEGRLPDNFFVPEVLRSEGIELFIRNRLSALTGPEGVQQEDTETGWSNPGFRFMNTRDLNFLMEAGNEADRRTLSEFFERDLNTTIVRYVQSAVKRAEYSKRFGQNGEKLSEMLIQAYRSGATQEEIDTAIDMVNAALGTHGRKTRALLAKIAHETGVGEQFFDDNGKVISDKLRNTMGWILTYQNYRLLVLSAFSSFVDPLGTAVRTGDVRIAANAMKEALRSTYVANKGDTTELQRLAELIGTVDKAMVDEEVIADYTGHQFTGVQKKLNEVLFKYNGVEAITRLSRLTATHGAFAFIAKHKNSNSERSTRYLEELNLQREDIVLDDNGNPKILSYTERNELADKISDRSAPPEERAAARDALERDTKMRIAVRRFVDSAIVRPDAGKRPLWMSDPHFALVGHLRSFLFAFHDTIFKRVGKEAMEGNLAPGMILFMTFLPMMMVADWIRDMIKYGPDGAPWKKDWTTADYLAYEMKRAGLLGRDELMADVAAPAVEGDIPKAIAEALGPTASQLRTLAMWGPGERDLPGQVLYRNWG